MCYHTADMNGSYDSDNDCDLLTKVDNENMSGPRTDPWGTHVVSEVFTDFGRTPQPALLRYLI